MIRSLALIFSAAALLAACASTPAYTPATTPSGVGYSEQRIENNRYYVTYRASAANDAALLSDYALLRSAELTLAEGKDWFWVDRRTLDDDRFARNSGPSVGVSVGGGSFGRSSGVGLGVGLSFPLGGPSGPQARSATMEIRLGDGVKPDEQNAYDARAIVANLRPRLTAPR